MYRKKLKAPTVDTCKFRRGVRREGDTEVATCKLLKALIECREDRWCRVRRDACDACCRSFPPSERNVNPVVASLLYDASARIVAAAPAGLDLKRIKETAQMAAEHVNVVYPQDEDPAVPKRSVSRALSQLVPPPAKRRGATVRQWAVGVTTAPRRQPTLEACLESLLRAGWETPHLFVDSAVQIPERFLDLPGTFRDEKTGAWPNYYLALLELLMRQPYADAYMIAQDDVLFFDRENLRQYLEDLLWPGRSSGLVSLYCSKIDTRPESGWHRREGWTAGAHAFVFPPELAKAFVMDPSVFGHRWAPDPVEARRVNDVIGNWALDHGLPVWFPTPSLVQHVGEASTLWPGARALGARRADPFAGDLE